MSSDTGPGPGLLPEALPAPRAHPRLPSALALSLSLSARAHSPQALLSPASSTCPAGLIPGGHLLGRPRLTSASACAPPHCGHWLQGGRSPPCELSGRPGGRAGPGGAGGGGRGLWPLLPCPRGKPRWEPRGRWGGGGEGALSEGRGRQPGRAPPPPAARPRPRRRQRRCRRQAREVVVHQKRKFLRNSSKRGWKFTGFQMVLTFSCSTGNISGRKTNRLLRKTVPSRPSRPASEVGRPLAALQAARSPSRPPMPARPPAAWAWQGCPPAVRFSPRRALPCPARPGPGKGEAAARNRPR